MNLLEYIEKVKEEKKETILRPSDARYRTLGQFFTPPELARTLAEYVKSFLYEEEGRKFTIFDPTAGEGNLLEPFAEEERFFTAGVEIDPDAAEKLKKKVDVALNADATEFLVEIIKSEKNRLYVEEDYSTSEHIYGRHLMPFSAFVMNPPYNLQVTLPEQVRELDFVSVKEKDGAFVSRAHEFFFEAAAVLARIAFDKGLVKTHIFSIHTKNHLEFLRNICKRYGFVAAAVQLGKAYPELDYEFVLVHAAAQHEYDMPRFYVCESFEQAKEKMAYEFVKGVPQERLKELKELFRQAERRRASAQRVREVIERVRPSITVKNGRLAVKNPHLLECCIAKVKHPVTAEMLSLREAAECYPNALIPLVKAELAPLFEGEPQRLEQIKTNVSLSPLGPVHRLAFAREGEFTAAEDYWRDGKKLIEKGKVYRITTQARRQERVVYSDEERRVSLIYKVYIIQVVDPRTEEVIMEVQL